jgi:hypothetical protein
MAAKFYFGGQKQINNRTNAKPKEHRMLPLRKAFERCVQCLGNRFVKKSWRLV